MSKAWSAGSLSRTAFPIRMWRLCWSNSVAFARASDRHCCHWTGSIRPNKSWSCFRTFCSDKGVHNLHPAAQVRWCHCPHFSHFLPGLRLQISLLQWAQLVILLFSGCRTQWTCTEFYSRKKYTLDSDRKIVMSDDSFQGRGGCRKHN